MPFLRDAGDFEAARLVPKLLSGGSYHLDVTIDDQCGSSAETLGWNPAPLSKHMSSLPKPTAEVPGSVPFERRSEEGFGPKVRRSEVAHWQTPWKFTIHACVGSLMFAIVAASAILLDWGMESAESVHPIDPIIILGLRVAGYAIFVLDLLLFFVFLWRTFKRTIREL